MYDIENIELLNEGGYNKGGNRINNISLYTKDDILLIHFDDIIFDNVAFETSGGIIYNNSIPEKNAVAVINFNEKLNIEWGDFKLILEEPKNFKKII